MTADTVSILRIDPRSILKMNEFLWRSIHSQKGIVHSGTRMAVE